MEQQEQHEDLETASQPQLMVTEDMRSYIYDIAKWANVLGIIGFVFSGFMLLAAITIGPAMSANPELGKMLGQFGTMDPASFTVVLIIYALAFSYPSFLMVRYAAKAKQGVLYGDQESLNEGMAKLKSLFKYFGMLAIFIIGVYIIAIFSGILGKVA